MKKIVVLMVGLLALFMLVSCQQDPVAQVQVQQTPAIRGSVSIPEDAGLKGSDFFVRIMEGEKAVYTGKVGADGSFSVAGLKEDVSYSLLLTTEEPGDVKGSEKDVSRASTSGYGGWLSNVSAAIAEDADIGSVKVKPLGTIKGVARKDGATDGYDTTVYIPGTSYLAMTDGEGNFSIFNVPQATYTLRYISNGYLARMVDNVVLYSADDKEHPVTTVTTQTLIKNAGNLIGAISRTGSEDHSGITVMLSDGENTYTGSTKEDGSLLMSGINPGTYSATVSSSGFITQTVEGIKIEAARNTTINPISLIANGGSIKGSVSMNDEGAKAGVLITARSSDGKYSYTTSTDTDGNFLIPNAFPGSYTLTLSKTGYAIQTMADVLSIAGQETDAGVFTFSSDYGTVEGCVVDKNGDGIENAIVKVGEISIFTDEEGGFLKTGIPLGNHSVSISKDGYGTKTLEQTITVESSKTTRVGTIRLASVYGLICGCVSVNDNGSVEGITVTASAEGVNSVSAKTDSDGKYTISDLKPGTYSIKAETSGYSIGTATVIVSADLKTEADDLALSNNYGTISGKVTDTKGNAIENAVVKIGEINVLTDSTGSFSKTGIGLGNYAVTVSCDGYTTKALSGEITVESSKTTTLGTIKLASIHGSISGKVTVNDSGSVSGIHISAVSSDGKNSYSTLTDSDGKYSLANMGAGDYTVTAKQSGYSDSTEDVTVVADMETSVPTMTLVSKYGSISGKVALENSADNSGVTITLTFTADTSIVKTAISGADGTYSINNLTEAGQYSVTLSKDGYVSNKNNVVTVVLGQNQVINDVYLKSLASKVSGIAKLAETEDYTGISILLKAKDNSIQYDATTDQQGSYVMARVNPGEYTLTVSKAGYISKTVEDIVVESSTEKELDDVSLKIGTRSITGSVTLELRDDHSGALITASNLADSTVSSAISNSYGAYTLAGLKPGEYSVSISCAGYNTVTLPTVNVIEGSEKNLEKVELPIARGTILGTAILEGRGSSAGITAELMKGTDVYATTTTDDFGLYAFSVPQGNYSGVRLSCENFKSVSIAQSIALIANDYVTIGEEHGATEMIATHVPVVKGRLTVKGLLSLDYSGIEVSIVENGMTTETDKDGYWSFSKVPVGSYTLKFERENTNVVTQSVDVVAAAEKNIGTIELVPNAASIEGHVLLDGMTDHSGVTVRATAEGMAELTTKTNAAGYFYLGNVVTTETYTIHFEKDGWVSQTRQVSGLEDLSLNDITEENPITLVDTTAPVLNSISVVVGNGEQQGRKLNVYFNAVESGSGLSKVFVNTSNDFTGVEPQNYSDPFACYVTDTEGEYTLYAKVVDVSGNESGTVSQTFRIADYKTVVSSVLLDNEDGNNDGIITWTKAKSPYYVAGNTLVDEDTTLVIEPGVNVQFSGDYYIQVEGKLEINGTENDKVYLYGVGAGENWWNGIKTVSAGRGTVDYAVMSGMHVGVQGSIDINGSQIIASISETVWGYALNEFKGTIENSYIEGSVYVNGASFLSDELVISGKIQKSVLSGNTMSGRRLEIHDSTLDNNSITSMDLVFYRNSAVNSTLSSCSLEITSDMIYKCEIDDCSFLSFSYGSILDSNIINCGKLTTKTQKSYIDQISLRNNYWGVNNTAELIANGVNSNLSFIVDYYDDFNVTKADLSGYKTSAIADAGYAGIEPSVAQYSIGDTGPAGGIVFYDKGYYSGGWRYLEAAPSDLGDGGHYIFGYYKKTDDGNSLRSGTAFGIGFGKMNTEILVEDMGDAAYTTSDGKTKTEEYGARLCYSYSYGGYSDWFLPSRDELNLMYINLHREGVGGFSNYYYLSSSESDDAIQMWQQNFGSGSKLDYVRSGVNLIRPVRAF